MSVTYQVTDEAERRAPSEALMASIRERFPTEAEVDRVLTGKMNRRARGEIYEGVTLERLVEGTEKLISARLGTPIMITNAGWLSGGASKLQMRFELDWNDNGEQRHDQLVLRMEPAASVTESSRWREFEVIKAVEGVIPAPKAYWVDAEAEFLPYPAIVYGFAQGAAKPSYDSGKISGLGQNFGPELRARLAPQFVGLLARLHKLDFEATGAMKHFERPEVGSNESVIRQVNAIRRVWEEDRVEEEPVMQIVYRWLIEHAPKIDHISVVHGDYRSGNFLFDEEAGEITAWLDWEGATLGDRHQDLTYAIMPSFAHLAEDGETLLGSGMMPSQAMFAAYEKESGLSVDPERLKYFNIYNRYLIVVLTQAASARASRMRGTHQDVLVNYVAPVGYPALADLIDFFQGATA